MQAGTYQHQNPSGRKHMKLAPKIAGMAVAVLAVGGAGVGTIAAASASTTHHAAVRTASEPTAPDTDAVQQGDQTSPDTATATTTGSVKAQSDNPGEAPESASESESSASDGPGGNADPAGNVQHEFSGTE
jgi:hypothetical protein